METKGNYRPGEVLTGNTTFYTAFSLVDITDSGDTSEILELFTVWKARAAVAVSFGATGILYTGNALITSISVDGGVEENATYSISLTGTGELKQNNA